MANEEQVALVKQGVEAWNAFRKQNPDVAVDLSGADFSGMDLTKIDFDCAHLDHAVLRKAKLEKASLLAATLNHAKLNNAVLKEAILQQAQFEHADLTEADLSDCFAFLANFRKATFERARCSDAQFTSANLSGTNFYQADLIKADLHDADLSDADLRQANLQGAHLIETNLTDADLTGSKVYAISAWQVNLERTKQQNLQIMPSGKPQITVDNIEVAQFVYLLLHNEKIRNVIDTIGKKGVLLLGRFTAGRMHILERLSEKLRDLGFVPMIFNFDKPDTKGLTDTIRLLANLSHFVIVDITNPRSAPLELQALVPDYMIPFVPIIKEGEEPFAMFADLQRYDWVLDPVIVYSSVDRLIELLEEKIVKPAEAKFNELLTRRTKQLRVEII